MENKESTIIELTDENGETVEFELLGTVTYEEDDYIVLGDMETMDEMEQDVYIMRVEHDEDGCDRYVNDIEDGVIERVFERFVELVEVDEEDVEYIECEDDEDE
ncbi:MAG: DUF1292 domain-containing protein [Clostridia bacterium]|nr:DUF1292 domain-containing protein [Clostridia bacterium]